MSQRESLFPPKPTRPVYIPIPYLVAGFYNITAENTGFKKFVRENVQVRVGDSVELNVQMSVGDIAEQVEVKADTPLLATADASLGQVVDERRVLELPLFSGNAMEFELMAPGAVNTTDMRLRKAPFNNAPSQFSTDGSGTYNNEFTIDGVPNTFSDSTQVRVAFSPPQASIGEFKVQTSTFDAAVGHTQGSLVNISTKGGEQRDSRLRMVVDSQLRCSTLRRSSRTGPARNCAQYTGQPLRTLRRRPRDHPESLQRQEQDVLAIHLGSEQVRRSQRGRRSRPRCRARRGENGDLSDLLKLGTSYQIYDPGHDRGGAERPLQPPAVRRQHHSPPTASTHRQEDPGALSAAQPAGQLPTAATTTSSPAGRWKITGLRSAAFDHAFSEKDRIVHPLPTRLSGWRTRTTTSSTIRPART